MWRQRTLMVFGTLVIIALASCSSPPAVLTQLVEARRLAAEMHVDFTKSSEASNRAVMADTDEASKAGADEARQARQAVERNLESLRSLLTSLGYSEDSASLEKFRALFTQYRQLDDEILPLAVENTNLKAQRLSFGASQQAADAFSAALDEASNARRECCAEAVATRARVALLRIQVMQAPHIAESDDATMTRIEASMTGAASDARKALAQLKNHDAEAALDRFLKINDEIIALSRRNTNVRSLALALGHKRTVTAECEDQLKALEEILARHEFAATR